MKITQSLIKIIAADKGHISLDREMLQCIRGHNVILETLGTWNVLSKGWSRKVNNGIRKAQAGF